MNLLLLLSALLSALTGVGAGRAPREPAAFAQRVAAAAERALPAVTTTARPTQSVAALARSARAPLAARLTLVDADPRQGRRRE